MKVTRILTAVVAAGLVAGTAMAQAAKAAPVTTKAAQDDVLLSQGTILYGGTLGWSMNQWSGEDYKTKSSELNIAPEIDYLVVDNVSLGVIANVNWTRMKWPGETDNQTALFAELVGRYYMPLCNNKIVPYVGATLGGGYAMDNFNYSDGGYSENSFLVTYGGQVGFLVPLNANVMLNTCVAYKRFQYNGYTTASAGETLDDVANKDRGETLLTLGFLIKY